MFSVDHINIYIRILVINIYADDYICFIIECMLIEEAEDME